MTCSIDPMGDARGERAASPPRVEPYDCTQCVGARIVARLQSLYHVGCDEYL
jgi:hypothetical protein